MSAARCRGRIKTRLTTRLPDLIEEHGVRAHQSAGLPQNAATAIAAAKGVEAAGRQLNHAAESRITADHYVETPRDVPDHRDVLDLYLGSPVGKIR
ncbi:hypothetical protein [Nocardia sp. NPDC048505]|uniref:hypothetical protein n=1 Tax=unclassified Nocardia TaxID=2637762 RepID=UPI0033DF006B